MLNVVVVTLYLQSVVFLKSKINCTITTGEPYLFLIETANLTSVSRQNSRPPNGHQHSPSHDSFNKC